MKKDLSKRSGGHVSIPVKKLDDCRTEKRKSLLVEIARLFKPSKTKRSACIWWKKTKKDGSIFEAKLTYQED